MFKDMFRKIEGWNERYAILRFFTSFFPLACCYGVFLFLYEIKFLREIVPAVHPVLIAWAGLAVAYSLFIRKDWKKIKGWQILLAFVVCVFITSVVNMQTGLVENVKACVFTLLPLFVFLPTFVSETKAQKKKHFLGILLGPAVLFCCASIVALVMYLMRFGKVFEWVGVQEHLGLRLYDPNVENSGVILYGIYKDTNHAAIYAVAFALYSVFLFLECKKGLYGRKWQNMAGMIFSAFNFVVQASYFPLANSRGGWLSLIVVLVVAGFLYIALGRTAGNCQPKTEETNAEGPAPVKLRRYSATHWVTSAVATLLVVAVCVGSLIGIRTAWANLSYELSAAQKPSGGNQESVSVWESESASEGTSESVPPSASEESESESTEQSSVDNEQSSIENVQSSESQNASSVVSSVVESSSADKAPDSFTKPSVNGGAGRLGIWKEGLQLYLKKPIFGQNAQNNAYYGMKYYPEGRFATGAAMHNSYLDLLLDYGIMGFITLLAFFVFCVVQILKRIFKGKELGIAAYLLIGVTLMCACGSLFLSCTFINTTAMYFLLTISVGYLIATPKEEE